MRVYEVRLRLEADKDCLPEHVEQEVYDGLTGASFGFDVEAVTPKFANVWEVDRLVEKIHRGQTDKSGAPYIEHLRAVAGGLRSFSTELQMAGLLHDTIEDTEWTAQALRDAGVQSRVVAIVEAVTNDPKLTYSEKIQRITANPQATLLKISDNAHNSRQDRLDKLDGETRSRLRGKYYKARRKLWPAAERHEVAMIVEAVNPDLLFELED